MWTAFTALRRVPASLLGWPVGSQEVARRNAMLAAAALADRRREAAEVEELLAGRLEQGRAAESRPA